MISLAIRLIDETIGPSFSHPPEQIARWLLATPLLSTPRECKRQRLPTCTLTIWFARIMHSFLPLHPLMPAWSVCYPPPVHVSSSFHCMLLPIFYFRAWEERRSWRISTDFSFLPFFSVYFSSFIYAFKAVVLHSTNMLWRDSWISHCFQPIAPSLTCKLRHTHGIRSKLATLQLTLKIDWPVNRVPSLSCMQRKWGGTESSAPFLPVHPAPYFWPSIAWPWVLIQPNADKIDGSPREVLFCTKKVLSSVGTFFRNVDLETQRLSMVPAHVISHNKAWISIDVL